MVKLLLCVVCSVVKLTVGMFASSQIWDFNLGRLRSQDEASAVEVGYGESNEGFMIKSYDELMKETSITTTKMLGDVYQLNGYLLPEDITLYNVRVSNV